MKGQWIGTFHGERPGKITLNLDEVADGYAGYAHLMDDAGQIPPAFAVLKSVGKANPFSLNATITRINPASHVALKAEELAETYPGIVFPDSATVTGKWEGRQISIQWQTNIGTNGTGILTGRTAEDKSEYQPQEMRWVDFKSHIDSIHPRKFIYRGQENPWRLRTSFHRTGRADVFEFEFQDISELHRVLSSRTKHIYNLADGSQNGAFYHLVQHHGYPTPLLDWTYSPFVAAFCAYRKISPEYSQKTDKVRIFMFDHIKWHEHWEKLQTLRTHKLHLSVLDFTAMDNDRMIPQQALSCVTNIDDVESYIREREKLKETTYLKVFDLPAADRNRAMMDLSVMGITAGSMFPGLDGTCEELKERLFNFDR